MSRKLLSTILFATLLLLSVVANAHSQGAVGSGLSARRRLQQATAPTNAPTPASNDDEDDTPTKSPTPAAVETTEDEEEAVEGEVAFDEDGDAAPTPVAEEGEDYEEAGDYEEVIFNEFLEDGDYDATPEEAAAAQEAAEAAASGNTDTYCDDYPDADTCLEREEGYVAPDAAPPTPSETFVVGAVDLPVPAEALEAVEAPTPAPTTGSADVAMGNTFVSMMVALVAIVFALN